MNRWLRFPRLLVLLLAALVIALVAATGVVWLGDRHAADQVAMQGAPMTDAQATEQILTSARQIVATAQLRDATGGYAFVSCKNANEPPYQVAAYLNFRLPQNNSVKYLRDVSATLAAHGWARAQAMGEHFGQKLTKDGVTAIFYANGAGADFATMRLYGECRNVADHRNDNPVWREVTGQLG
jgi:hypothetical protein